jgi:hypothetical protein
MKKIILSFIMIFFCSVALAQNKKIQEQNNVPVEKKYHSIFELDTNNITVEVCCLPKGKPDFPFYPVPPGSWF